MKDLKPFPKNLAKEKFKLLLLEDLKTLHKGNPSIAVNTPLYNGETKKV